MGVGKLVFRPPAHDLAVYEKTVAGIHAAGGECYYLNTTFMWKFPRGRPSPVALVVSHGNAEDVTTNWALVHVMALVTGCTTYGYDYPGYGLSTASATASSGGGGQEPSELATYDSIAQVFAHVATQHEKVLLVGQSLGTGPTCWVSAVTATAPTPSQALKQSLGGIVLISPFLSIFAAGLHARSSFGWLDMFDNHSNIMRTECPVWIVHGTDDVICPLHHSETLRASAARASRVSMTTLPSIGHNDVWDHVDAWTTLRQAVAHVAASVVPPVPPVPPLPTLSE